MNARNNGLNEKSLQRLTQKVLRACFLFPDVKGISALATANPFPRFAFLLHAPKLGIFAIRPFLPVCIFGCEFTRTILSQVTASRSAKPE